MTAGRQPHWAGRCGRAVLWAALGVLTVALFAYPIRPTVDYSPMQSLSAIPNVPLFAALLYVWLTVLFSLFLLMKESKWAQVTLVVVFALVSLGIWVVMAGGNSGEAQVHAAHVDYINRLHHLRIIVPNFSYFQFPGLFVLASSLAQVTGLSTWNVVVTLVLLEDALFAALLYLAFYNASRSPHLAWLGVLLVIQGSPLLNKALSQFHPGSFVLLFYAAFLFLVTRQARGIPDLWQNRLLVVVLLGAATVTHFVTSIALLVVVAGMALLRQLTGRLPQLAGQKYTVVLPGILLPLVLPLAWEVYHAVYVFDDVANLFVGTWEKFAGGELLTRYADDQVGGYVGGSSAPLWALALRYFWLLVVLGLGGVVLLWNLLRARRLSPDVLKMTGGAVGIGLLSVLIAFSSGSANTFRFLFYMPLFTVMALLVWIAASGQRVRRFGSWALALPIFILFLPTFLNNNFTIGLNVYYPTEAASAEYLRANYGRGENLTVFSNRAPLFYRIPDATFSFPDPLAVGEERFWKELQENVQSFKGAPGEEYGSRIWVYSRRVPSALQHLLGRDPLAVPEFGRIFQQEVPQAASRIYDNGGTQLYRAEERQPTPAR